MIFLIYGWKMTGLIYLEHNDKIHPIPIITQKYVKEPLLKLNILKSSGQGNLHTGVLEEQIEYFFQYIWKWL